MARVMNRTRLHLSPERSRVGTPHPAALSDDALSRAVSADRRAHSRAWRFVDQVHSRRHQSLPPTMAFEDRIRWEEWIPPAPRSYELDVALDTTHSSVRHAMCIGNDVRPYPVHSYNGDTVELALRSSAGPNATMHMLTASRSKSKRLAESLPLDRTLRRAVQLETIGGPGASDPPAGLFDSIVRSKRNSGKGLQMTGPRLDYIEHSTTLGLPNLGPTTYNLGNPLAAREPSKPQHWAVTTGQRIAPGLPAERSATPSLASNERCKRSLFLHRKI